MILFEYPFNERVRTYLRLEHLFARLLTVAARSDALDHHHALETLFEIMDVCARADLKTEILKDLGRQKVTLSSFKGNPAIQENALDEAVKTLDDCFDQLSQNPGRTGQSLLENDWLMAVRSRASIPGGTCSFDLPAYYAWQQQAADVRKAHLKEWIQCFMPMHRAVIALLNLLRDSGVPQKMVATSGLFQQHLPQGKTFQLLRLTIDPGLGVVPEISANRLLVSVRFVHSTVNARGTPASKDVSFELALST